jgi:hypothetical protein
LRDTSAMQGQIGASGASCHPFVVPTL